MGGALTGWLLGMLLGMRHALEPDHLAAVGTLVAEKPRARTAAWMGACWGIGHAATLVAVGGLLLALRTRMPQWLEQGFELAVAVMLVALGARGLIAAARAGRTGTAARAPHRHGLIGHAHEHDGPAGHLHLGRWTLARRPLVVGLVHGLAGSGALTAAAVASTPGRAEGIVFVVLFGIGSVAGMAAISGLSFLSLARFTRRPGGEARLLAVAGTISLVTGGIWAWPILSQF